MNHCIVKDLAIDKEPFEKVCALGERYVWWNLA